VTSEALVTGRIVVQKMTAVEQVSFEPIVLKIAGKFTRTVRGACSRQKALKTISLDAVKALL